MGNCPEYMAGMYIFIYTDQYMYKKGAVLFDGINT